MHSPTSTCTRQQSMHSPTSARTYPPVHTHSQVHALTCQCSHSPINPCTHPLVLSLTHQCMQSPISACTHPSVHALTHQCSHSGSNARTHPSVHALTCRCMHPPTSACTHQCTHPPVHALTYQSMHSPTSAWSCTLPKHSSITKCSLSLIPVPILTTLPIYQPMLPSTNPSPHLPVPSPPT